MTPIILFAAKGGGSPEEAVIFLAVLVGIIVLIALFLQANTHLDVVLKGGLPFCPQCNRQVTFRRDYCRACGYQFRTYGKQAEARQNSSPGPHLSPLLQPTGAEFKIPIPVSHWERLHRDPSDAMAKISLRDTTKKMLEKRLLGPKKIDQDVVMGKIILRRSRLQYESHIETCVGDNRHGFIVTVPSHGFRIRITCPRAVPADVIGAPWDDLFENLCKIDRSIIRSRESKSMPLTYNPVHGQHPMLRVEILGKNSPQQKALPNGD